MVITDNNPNLLAYVCLIVCIGIIVYLLLGILILKLREAKLKHLKGLIIENHKKFKRKRNI